MYSRNAADAGAYCHRVVLSWALFPGMVATGTDRIFANLFWMALLLSHISCRATQNVA